MQTPSEFAGLPLPGKKGINNVAIFDLSIKTVTRSAGHSATAAAAYQSAGLVVDERTGEVFDYRAKGKRENGVAHTEIVMPPICSVAADRATLWNAAEAAENRKNSVVARKVEIALPHEMTDAQRQTLTGAFAADLAERYGVAVDVAIHRPDKKHATKIGAETIGGDPRNHHAHLLITTRRLDADGKFGEKTRELDAAKTGSDEFKWIREKWATRANEHLKTAKIEAAIDHRSLKDRGIDRAPNQHFGQAALAIERKQKGSSRKIRAHRVRQLALKLEKRISSLTARLLGRVESPKIEPAKKIHPLETLRQLDFEAAKRIEAVQKWGVSSETRDQLETLAGRLLELKRERAGAGFEPAELAQIAGQAKKISQTDPLNAQRQRLADQRLGVLSSFRPGVDKNMTESDRNSYSYRKAASEFAKTNPEAGEKEWRSFDRSDDFRAQVLQEHSPAGAVQGYGSTAAAERKAEQAAAHQNDFAPNHHVTKSKEKVRII
jgi:hypothetical protein